MKLWLVKWAPPKAEEWEDHEYFPELWEAKFAEKEHKENGCKVALFEFDAPRDAKSMAFFLNRTTHPTPSMKSTIGA